MNWLTLLESIGPAALAFTPAAPFIPAVIAGIKLAESKGGTKEEKKALAVDTAIKIAQGTDAIKAGTVDPATLGHVVDTGIETVVGVVNLVQKGPAVVKVVPVAEVPPLPVADVPPVADPPVPEAAAAPLA